MITYDKFCEISFSGQCSKCKNKTQWVAYFNPTTNELLEHKLHDFNDLCPLICYDCYSKIQPKEDYFSIEKGMTSINNKMFFMTWKGHKIYPESLAECTYDIEDIAHHLSIVRRYGGATNIGVSSGYHSLLVYSYMPQPLKLLGLLHDASDAYMNDMISAIKYSKKMEGYMELEREVQSIIYKQYGITEEFVKENYATLKRWDMAALAAEARCFTNHDWWKKIPECNLIIEKLNIPPDAHVESLFLAAFYKETKK